LTFFFYLISVLFVKNYNYFLLSIIFGISLLFLLIDSFYYFFIPFFLVIILGFFVSGVMGSIFSFVLLLFWINFLNYQIWNSFADFNFLMFYLLSFLVLFYFFEKHEKNRFNLFLKKFDFGFIFYLVIFSLFYFLVFSMNNFIFYFSFTVVSIVLSFLISYAFIILFGLGMENISLAKMRWLLDLGNPVLSRLSTAASGTFNHSLRVSELAEACAQAIGANSLLVKIAALYHDIGKIERPKYFAENISTGEENPHDNIEPYLSASIIKRHVIDGVKLARENKLPPIIDEFIKTHHGTTTILYFFIKAKNLQNLLRQSTKDSVEQLKAFSSKKYYFEIKEEDFKYPGPKPYTKEMLILMICDSVEAASRSLTDFSYTSISKLTNSIIDRLSKEEQFSEVDLTFKELETIKETLIKNLYISLHTRVKYPSYEKK
jgi:putative nucleotidyltransferase with HDIG domain